MYIAVGVTIFSTFMLSCFKPQALCIKTPDDEILTHCIFYAAYLLLPFARAGH